MLEHDRAIRSRSYDRRSVERKIPSGREFKSSNQIQSRRLAAPCRTDNREYLRLIDGELQLTNGYNLIAAASYSRVGLSDVVKDDLRLLGLLKHPKLHFGARTDLAHRLSQVNRSQVAIFSSAAVSQRSTGTSHPRHPGSRPSFEKTD